MGFPGGSAGKKSTCNEGDLGLIPGLGRSPGEGNGYPHQYSWASLVAQLVKNPTAMRETWVRSLRRERLPTPVFLGFPGGSAGKESSCNDGELGSIPELGRSPGGRKGYPLQYSWASLVAQMIKNPPAMQETWIRSLSWEDPLEKGTATYSSILAWRIPWTV